MKGYMSVIISAVLALAVLPAIPAQAQTVQVLVDGQPVAFDQPPVVMGGRVLVPLRGVFERLGALVQWDPSRRTVAALHQNAEIELTIGSRQAMVNGRTVLLDVPAMIVGGRTLVPLRFVSEAMGARVDWSPVTRVVSIVSPLAQPVLQPVPQPAPAPAPPSQATPSVLQGTVIHVDMRTSPPRIFVQREGTVHAFAVTPDTTITRLNLAASRGSAISLDQVRVGDNVRITADSAGRAILIQVRVREVTGRVDAVTGRMILLADGQSFILGDNVRILIDGREVPAEQLRQGMEVTLRLDPQSGRVVEILGRTAVGQPAQPAPGGVRIASLTHDATRPLRAGDTINVRLQGTPGAVASFDIFNVASGVPMREIAPGIYQGSHSVRPGDNVANAAIFGRLRLAAQEAPLVQAATAVTIDTLPPRIEHRFPEPGTVINNARPNILVIFQDQGPAGINPQATRLFVNGEDLTARASITETAVAYNPPQPMSGPVNVRVVLTDRAGNTTDDRFAFTATAAAAGLIRSVTISPTTTVRPGDLLEITMTGEPGGQASFSVQGLAEGIPMREVQPGVYVGNWRVPAVPQAAQARITVQLARGGTVSRADVTAPLTVLTDGVAAPVISFPAPGTRVGTPITIRGRATPGHRVVVRVDYQASVLLVVNLRGTYGEVTTTADASGNWEVTIPPSVRIPQAELTIRAVAIDPLGRQSQPTEIQVIQG